MQNVRSIRCELGDHELDQASSLLSRIPPAHNIASKWSAQDNDETLGDYVLRTFRCPAAASGLRRLDGERSDAALRSTGELWAEQIVDESPGEPEIEAALRFGVQWE
jgi:hypothetical protein